MSPELELLSHFLCSIAGLYIWEVFFRKWYFKKWKLIKEYKNSAILPKSYKDIPNWFKNTVVVWVKSKF
jgi:hypothetical protein|tara:strand:+ start:287 stop:493 length:207 start_codon:yes stop_codon:yes gene_type:complete